MEGFKADIKPLIQDNLFCRQTGIIRPDELKYHVLIIGAGGIGSWTALSLAKMGIPRMTIVDFDTIEEVNLAPQFYGVEHNGLKKAEAIASRINNEWQLSIATSVIKIWEDWAERKDYIRDQGVDIVIMAVDSIDVRKNIWEDIKYEGLRLVVDGRMSKEQMEILAVQPQNPDEIAFYEKRLFPASSVDHVPCTERAVAYNQFVIAGLIGATIKHFAKKELEYKRLIMDLYSMSLISQ